MSKTVTLVLPLPPDKLNARMHWATRRKLENFWQSRARMWLYRDGHKRPETPLERVRVHAHVVTMRAMDLDNATARGCKLPLDFLVRAGWLRDDGPAHVLALNVTTAVDRKNPRVELTLTHD